MTYPVHLLPKPTDRILEDASIVLERTLLRAIFGALDAVYDPITERFREKLFPSRETLGMRDLSTCLYGTFQPEDFQWQITGPKKSYWTSVDWTPGEVTGVPTEEEVQRVEVTGCASLSVADVHERTFEVTNRPEIGRIVIRVLHTPNRSNIHHFSIRCYLDGTDAYVGSGVRKLKKNSLERAVLTLFRLELRELFRLGTPSEMTIPREPYLGEGEGDF